MVGLAFLTAACGFLSSAGGNSVPDGSASADSGGEAAAPAICDGGNYFIVVGDDAGAQVLQGGCPGFSVPTFSFDLCGEDCACDHVTGCSDASALDLHFAQSVCGNVTDGGTYFVERASWTTGGTTTSGWSGSIRFDPFPASAGPLTGDYSITLVGDAGGENTLAGTFCVQP